MIALRESFQTDQDGGAPDPLGSVMPWTEAIFAPQGWLCDLLRLEHRPQQEIMAVRVARAMAGRVPLLFEAGTGVGKSLAYLIPGLLAAHASSGPLVVSTNTIALQEQIRDKDFPLALKLFAGIPDLSKLADSKAALLVGKGNYLCANRLTQALRNKGDLFGSEESAELMRIAEWARQTAEGLREELNPPPLPEVWEWVNADSSACDSRTCRPETCFYRRARQRVTNARLIIVNHSLLFALLGAGAGHNGQSPGVLFPNDMLVLDEAHTIPAIATEYAGDNLSSYGFDRLLKRLFNPRHRKGLLSRHGSHADVSLVEELLSLGERFFTNLRQDVLRDKPILRLYEAGWGPPDLLEPLTVLSARLGKIAAKIEDDSADSEVRDLRSRLDGFRTSLFNVLSMADGQMVYWLEKAGRRQTIVHIRTAPIDVAPFLRSTLFEKSTAVILTSATLAEGPGMESFKNRVGAHDVEAEQVLSPFDYDRQMRIYAASDAPEPAAGSGRLDLAYLAEMIGYCALQARGGSLVLFTSRGDMKAVAASLDGRFASAGRLFLMQGRDGPRSELMRRFKASGEAILFGTDSFWVGVDVPGRALSQVIITRLPFENPSHPVAEARAEWVRARGGQPFHEITLPAAVVKFRQGVGRLIRNKTDLGTITILDSRLMRKPYGKRFQAILPGRKIIPFTAASRDQVFRILEANLPGSHTSLASEEPDLPESEEEPGFEDYS